MFDWVHEINRLNKDLKNIQPKEFIDEKCSVNFIIRFNKIIQYMASTGRLRVDLFILIDAKDNLEDYGAKWSDIEKYCLKYFDDTISMPYCFLQAFISVFKLNVGIFLRQILLSKN